MICRQVIRPLRKPLIVLTPKSLLRHKLAVSSLAELEKGYFLPVISEIDKITAASVRKIVLCTGKVYYELLEKRRLDNQADVVIVRIEQLYPFPDTELKTVLSQYPNANQIIWCQEEPQNQGAWTFIQPYIQGCLSEKQILNYMGREPAAAPAVGYLHLHQMQQIALVKDALS
jgi:2-oxoglutarate dehydrogenase E1 component